MPSTSLRTLSFLVILGLASLTPGRPAPAPLPFPLPLPIAQNAYTGTGGHSSGGSVKSLTGSTGGLLSGGALEILSGNAGNGGKAESGPALAGASVATQNGTASVGAADAYTGTGGDAKGGNVDESSKALVQLLSENAGNAGNAGSGTAAAGVGSVVAPVGGKQSKSGLLLVRRMIRVRRPYASAVQSHEGDGL